MTGATSLLGSNLLFEIIKQNINDLINWILSFWGKENGKNLSWRISDIFEEEGILFKGTIMRDSGVFQQRIECMEMDLERRLGMTRRLQQLVLHR